VAEVAEHTRVQFLQTTERQFAHVTDATRLAAVDGERLDAGTPDEDAHSVDPEDYPVLFALEAERARLAHRPPRKLARWDALVVDEAQELAPLELELLARALKPGGTLTVAGDAAQQLDETTTFQGWEGTMASLGVDAFEQATLEVNYRCPPEVTALARAVLGGQPDPGAQTNALVRLAAPHAAQHLLWLIGALRDYTTAHPTASVAVICRSAEAARSLARQLGHGLSVHLALQGDFKFRPGLVVTAVGEVKGLEFDAVVVPEAAGPAFTSTPEARRALYVAVTRATHLLALTQVG
jgi:DNA helicase IV